MKKFVLILALLGLFLLCSYVSVADSVAKPTAPNTSEADELTSEIESFISFAQFNLEYMERFHVVREIAHRHNKLLGDSIIYCIVDMSYKYESLPVELICATITYETGKTWDPHSLSPVGAMGMMQIMPGTGNELAAKESIRGFHSQMLYNPELNIQLGCRYLNMMVTKYGVSAGLAGYNGGEVRARYAHRGEHEKLPSETRQYIKNVVRLYEEYCS